MLETSMELMNIIFNEETFHLVLKALFVVALVAIFRVKFLLKKDYLKQHNELFGQSIFEYSMSKSINATRFMFSKSKWEFVQERKTLTWLKFNRFMLSLYGLYFFGGLLYIFTIGWN